MAGGISHEVLDWVLGDILEGSVIDRTVTVRSRGDRGGQTDTSYSGRL